jgi:predicted O-linked N-acetylglucosamine transferase (SPINDLY family)
LGTILAAWPANITPPLSTRQQGRLSLGARRQHETLQLQAIDALMLRNEWDAATDELERALTGAPGAPAFHERLGTLHARAGDVELARHHLGEVLRQDPANAAVGSRLLVMMNYDPHASPQTVFEAHREWAERHAAALTRLARPHKNSPDPQRQLRIGYVSPDFKDHPIGSFLKRVLASHDRERFDVTCFSDVAAPDVFTADLRKHAAHWRATRGLRDDALAERIASEQIDILIDLTGHTPENRLLTFARRPAPVQITWLGYCNTTGMDAMDWIVGDDITDPPDATQPYAERVLRLPTGFSCYEPRFDAPQPNELPAKSSDSIVLGAFHKLIKLNDATLDLWANVLRSLPQAHLLFWRDMMRGRAADRVRAAMEKRGIAPDRYTLRGQNIAEGSHLLMYHSIDISLDALPWSGHTTACESIWMGVPFVTLRGNTHASRMAASALVHAGAGEFVADSSQQYVEIVNRLADDRARLANLRAALRPQMQNSRLLDGAAFTAAWESALSNAWMQWCSSKS